MRNVSWSGKKSVMKPHPAHCAYFFPPANDGRSRVQQFLQIQAKKGKKKKKSVSEWGGCASVLRLLIKTKQVKLLIFRIINRKSAQNNDQQSAYFFLEETNDNNGSIILYLKINSSTWMELEWTGWGMYYSGLLSWRRSNSWRFLLHWRSLHN